MSNIRKKHSADFKARVALEALKGLKTISELSSHHSVHSTQITNWKKQLSEALPKIFSKANDKEKQNQAELIENLYKQIGQLTVKLDWLKKKINLFSG